MLVLSVRARELPMQLKVLARGGLKRRAQLLCPTGQPEVLVVKRIANDARSLTGRSYRRRRC
jgi:hypothetical protein